MATLGQRAEEILSKIVKHGDCWLYPTQRRAYLTVSGIQTLVYRILYEHTKGPIPEGKYLLHSCDNKHCVNPDHLDPGSQRSNVLQAVDRGQVNSAGPIPGVSWQQSRGRWLVMPRVNGEKVCLYAGKDMFEAICTRKSFDLKCLPSTS